MVAVLATSVAEYLRQWAVQRGYGVSMDTADVIVVRADDVVLYATTYPEPVALSVWQCPRIGPDRRLSRYVIPRAEPDRHGRLDVALRVFAGWSGLLADPPAH